MSGLVPCDGCAVNCACESCGGNGSRCREHAPVQSLHSPILLPPGKHVFVIYVIRHGELFAAEDRHGPEVTFYVGLGEPFMLRFQTKTEAERHAQPGDEVLTYVEFD